MRALVLGGGGAYGAYQAGVAYHLLGAHHYDVLVGTSVGALNAAFIAQFPAGKSSEAASALCDLWGRASRRDVYRHWIPFSVIHGFLPGWFPGSKPSFFDTSKGLEKFLVREVSCKEILNSGRKLVVAAHDVKLNTTCYFRGDIEDPHFHRRLLASSAIPGVFPPVCIEGEHFIDGGVQDMVPLKGLESFPEVTHADVIICQNQTVSGSFENGVDALLYASDVVFDGAIASDLLESHLDPKNVRVFRPGSPLPSHPLNFKSSNLVRLMRIGMVDAKKIHLAR